jgi:hypothetical protein
MISRGWPGVCCRVSGNQGHCISCDAVNYINYIRARLGQRAAALLSLCEDRSEA